MPSKFDLLREGQAVEVEPGVSARLNKDKKRLELSTGEVMNVANDRDFFPENEQALGLSREKEQIQRNIGQSPLGEFGYQFSQKGLLGGAKDWADFVTAGDRYITRKQAQHEVSEGIAEKSPWTSRAATVASFVPDIALTRGMSALKAAPLLTLGSAGSRVLTEPGQVALETGLAAGGGHLIDKTVGYLGKVAQRRAASRAMPARQEAVRTQNLAGQQATQAENVAQKQNFNALQERVKNENAARLHQHNLALNDRQNTMIQRQNAYEQAKAAREAEVFRLKNEYETAKATRSADASRLEGEYKAAKTSAEQEVRRLNDEYKLAQQQYQEQLKSLPTAQKEAQAEYSRNVLRNVEEIEGAFPKNSRIITDQLGTQQFIDEAINSTGFAGSREGGQASRILKSLFPEGEILTSKELAKRYQAIEEAIQKGNPEVQNILAQYKQFLGKRLPAILEDTIAYTKIMPTLEKSLEKEVVSILNQIPLGAQRPSVINLAKSNLKGAIREISPDRFVQKLQTGELSQFLKNRILTPEDMLAEIGMHDINRLKKQGLYDMLTRNNAIDSQHAFFTTELGKKLDNKLARAEIKVMEAGKEASKKLGKTVKKTYGLAEPVAPPTAPIAPEPLAMPNAPGELPEVARPQFPGPLTPPDALPMPAKPSLMGEPTPPIPKTFNAQPEPTLAPAGNMAERAGDFFEKPLFQGKGVNNLLKLGALKYALGPAALPVEAGAAALYGAGKLLTSAGAVGEAARLSFKQGGIRAIEALAQKYPSYHDGILENPQERRSLTKEVEDDPEIPIEQKAIIQSKINRGRPLSQPLQ